MTDPNDDQRAAATRTTQKLLRPALERAGTVLINPPQHVLDTLRWHVEHGDRCLHLELFPVQPTFVSAGDWIAECETCFVRRPRIRERACHLCGVDAPNSPGPVLVCDDQRVLVLRLCDGCRHAVGALHSPDLRPATD